MKPFFIFGLVFLGLLTSCSHNVLDNKISITTATNGLMKSPLVKFPVYLTDTLEARNTLEKKYNENLFIIHTGHLLNPNFSKNENEKILNALANNQFDLVNLTLEDFVIAEAQGIQFSNYNQVFLNSSVIDLGSDTLVNGKNVQAFAIHDGVAFIGLSDQLIDQNLPREKYIIDDYVLSVLKVKKIALKKAEPTPLRSFVIIHTLGSEINEVMERLPPNFINSKAY